jgi:Putative auto-transporter adhesin, head GIN domain
VEIVLTSVGGIAVGEIAAKTVLLDSSGTGEMKVGKLTADQLDVNAFSVGGVTIEQGGTTTFNVVVDGTGNLNARGLIAQNVKARLSSVGQATVYAGQTIESDLSGTGDLLYAGGATVVSANASSVGAMKKM